MYIADQLVLGTERLNEVQEEKKNASQEISVHLPHGFALRDMYENWTYLQSKCKLNYMIIKL